MPNFIKKVLANTPQSLSVTEQQRARDNIGVARYKKLTTYDPLIHNINDARAIVTIGNFIFLYYHGNDAELHLAVENIDVANEHTIRVLDDYTSDESYNLGFGIRQALSVSFSNSHNLYQHLRIVFDDTDMTELSIQHMQTPTPQLWYKQ